MRKYFIRKIILKSECEPGLAPLDTELAPTAYELVLPSPGEKDFYRQTTSLNWFFWGNGRNRTKDFIFLCSNWHEIEIDIMLWECYKYLPRVVVHSMWDFYKEIGYDYKKQKWLKETS